MTSWLLHLVPVGTDIRLPRLETLATQTNTTNLLRNDSRELVIHLTLSTESVANVKVTKFSLHLDMIYEPKNFLGDAKRL